MEHFHILYAKCERMKIIKLKNVKFKNGCLIHELKIAKKN